MFMWPVGLLVREVTRVSEGIPPYGDTAADTPPL